MDPYSSSKSTQSVLPYLFTVMLAAIPSGAQGSPAGPLAAPNQLRPSRLVVVSIPDRKLVVVEGETALATFSVAVGAARTPSPSGTFAIVSRVTNPTYYRRGLVIPTGQDNPVGTRWLGLSLKGYGIHGTNAPGSVGRAASHGCIRLRNREMEQLFSMLQIGDRVEIHSERDEKVARFFNQVPAQQIVAAAQTAPAAGGQ